jgi:hypothetical protein
LNPGFWELRRCLGGEHARTLGGWNDPNINHLDELNFALEVVEGRPSALTDTLGRKVGIFPVSRTPAKHGLAFLPKLCKRPTTHGFSRIRDSNPDAMLNLSKCIIERFESTFSCTGLGSSGLREMLELRKTFVRREIGQGRVDTCVNLQ